MLTAQGVFVIPFQPDTAAGPSAAASAPEPLAATYAAAHKRFEDAYWVRSCKIAES
jgi:hypothetical protein